MFKVAYHISFTINEKLKWHMRFGYYLSQYEFCICGLQNFSNSYSKLRPSHQPSTTIHCKCCWNIHHSSFQDAAFVSQFNNVLLFNQKQFALWSKLIISETFFIQEWDHIIIDLKCIHPKTFAVKSLSNMFWLIFKCFVFLTSVCPRGEVFSAGARDFVDVPT